MPNARSPAESSFGHGTSKQSESIFEGYLENVRSFMQSSQLHLTSANISMERCRDALEWQSAVQLQLANLNDTVHENVVRLVQWGEQLSAQRPTSADIAEWQNLMSATLELQRASVLLMTKSRVFQKKMIELSEVIVTLEQFSTEIAILNDSVVEQSALLTDSFLHLNPQTKR